MNHSERKSIETAVAELKPKMRGVNITFKVIETGPQREVKSPKDGTQHSVLDAVVGDTTGTVRLPVWDGAIKALQNGGTYTLTKGYTHLFKGSLRLHVGKFGTIAESGRNMLRVNTALDMSAID